MNLAKDHVSRRLEVVIDKNDNRLLQAAAKTLVHSMSQNTNRTYANNFVLFLGFCTRQGISPVLNGWNKKVDEDTLIMYVMYEFEIHKKQVQHYQGETISHQSCYDGRRLCESS
jgi:hypothetical protein